MFHTATDRAWEMIGKVEPYFGVLVESKYKASVLTDRTREEFFRTGEEYIERMVRCIRRHFDHSCAFQRALDFGRGVGRLVIPLARRAEEVVGVDISKSMLNEAEQNCRRRHLTNVTLIRSGDRLTLLDGQYDLIHSYIVLQHIPARRGYRIITNLLLRLQEGGIGVLHVTYGKDSLKRKAISWIRKCVPLAVNFVNVIKGRPFFAPQMQMSDYDLNRLFSIMQTNQVREFHAEYTDHGGHLGLILYFQKPRMR